MAPVAGAVVASEVAGVGYRDAAQVGAHSDDHEPLGLDRALVVVLWVAQGFDCHGLFGGDLGCCPGNFRE